MATRWLGRPATRITAAAMVVAAAVCAAVAAPAWADSNGALRILDQDRNGNEVRLKVFSPAMNKELPITVLLPADYDSGRSFPVLYALGGAAEKSDRTWVEATDIKSFAESHGAVIVLPPTQPGTFFSDWYDGTEKWETFHTSEVPALIRSEFKGSGPQAIMGISLGGFAAMKYAAHNPGQYSAAASLSGVLVSSTPGMASLFQTSMRLTGGDPSRIWGDPIAQHAKWRYEDPSEQLDGLRGTNLFVSSGSGIPTFADRKGGDGSPVERVTVLTKDPLNVGQQVLGTSLEQPSTVGTDLFARKATAAGLNVVSSHPIRGVHNWALWKWEYKVAWSKVLAPSLGLPN